MGGRKEQRNREGKQVGTKEGRKEGKKEGRKVERKVEKIEERKKEIQKNRPFKATEVQKNKDVVSSPLGSEPRSSGVRMLPSSAIA